MQLTQKELTYMSDVLEGLLAQVTSVFCRYTALIYKEKHRLLTADIVGYTL